MLFFSHKVGSSPYTAKKKKADIKQKVVHSFFFSTCGVFVFLWAIVLTFFTCRLYFLAFQVCGLTGTDG